jgi:glycosyltransferase involved in cell wall biosynthesis
MVIGVDASRCFEEEKTGTERYAYETLRHILMLPEAREQEWIVYTKANAPSYPPLNLRGGRKGELLNVRFVRIRLPFLWTQVGLAARTWIDRLDVLWVPAHTLPVFTNPFIRTVATVHGLEYEWLPSFRNLFQRYYLPLSTSFVAKRASQSIAVSEFTKRELVGRLGVGEKKISIIYEGVSQSSNGKSQNFNSKLLSKYNLEPKKYILSVGTVQPRKNFGRLIEAISMLNTQYSMLKLVIVGKPGWDYEQVYAAPGKLGIADKVVFAGYISDEERNILLQNALVYVQPSITEGFGLPVIEAMAAGIPVVISNGGALPEPAAIASITGNPNPSVILGCTYTNAFCNKIFLSSSDIYPAKTTLSAIPNFPGAA